MRVAAEPELDVGVLLNNLDELCRVLAMVEPGASTLNMNFLNHLQTAAQDWSMREHKNILLAVLNQGVLKPPDLVLVDVHLVTDVRGVAEPGGGQPDAHSTSALLGPVVMLLKYPLPRLEIVQVGIKLLALQIVVANYQHWLEAAELFQVLVRGVKASKRSRPRGVAAQVPKLESLGARNQLPVFISELAEYLTTTFAMECHVVRIQVQITYDDQVNSL
mmetsp:Transcript_17085/g.32716  ORF Transcript_17085/g.32716 Transcript_17085/m.32716 type:complete len:219 (+) Transcript_17085:971-1627(+)